MPQLIVDTLYGVGDKAVIKDTSGSSYIYYIVKIEGIDYVVPDVDAEGKDVVSYRVSYLTGNTNQVTSNVMEDVLQPLQTIVDDFNNY